VRRCVQLGKIAPLPEEVEQVTGYAADGDTSVLANAEK
jgi:hypothetical protein